jgi:transcriptional regulator with XRE-family HTH domain
MLHMKGPHPKPLRRRHFLREWREFRGYTQEQAADMIGIDRTVLSKIERRYVPYGQDLLEKAAEIYMTDIPSLIIRDPSEPDAIWSLWDRAGPGQRAQIIEVAKVLLKAG